MRISVLASLLGLALLSCPTRAQVVPTLPDPALSTATSNATNYMVAPAPIGPSLAEVDGVITVVVLDFNGDPIANFPREDIWLTGAEGSNFAPCPSNGAADGPTDATGSTTFSQRIRGGGHSDGLRVVLSGMPLVGPPLPIAVNGPDYDGDRVISIVDISALADDFLSGSYHFDSDFNHDGVLDLADIGIFAEALFGPYCP